LCPIVAGSLSGALTQPGAGPGVGRPARRGRRRDAAGWAGGRRSWYGVGEIRSRVAAAHH